MMSMSILDLDTKRKRAVLTVSATCIESDGIGGSVQRRIHEPNDFIFFFLL